MKLQRSTKCSFQFNFDKTYNRVEWDFIVEITLLVGIWECVYSSHGHFLLNASTRNCVLVICHKLVVLQRSIKQGHP